MVRARSLLCVLIGTSGCYVSHGHPPVVVDAGMDAPILRVDAGIDAARDAGIDSGPDGGPDAGPECALPTSPGSVHSFCFLDPTAGLTVGAPSTLVVSQLGCFCRDTLLCDTRIEGHAIHLTTQICPGPEICDGGCIPELVTECNLPALTAGQYQIHLDGRFLFEVEARAHDPSEHPRPTCWTFGERPDPMATCAPASMLTSGAEICRPSVSDVGSEPGFELRMHCATCFDVAVSCSTTIADGHLLVRALTSDCDCSGCGGGCGPGCQELVVHCRPPALRAGAYPIDFESGPSGLSLLIQDISPTDPITTVCDEIGG